MLVKQHGSSNLPPVSEIGLKYPDDWTRRQNLHSAFPHGKEGSVASLKTVDLTVARPQSVILLFPQIIVESKDMITSSSVTDTARIDTLTEVVTL